MRLQVLLGQRLQQLALYRIQIAAPDQDLGYQHNAAVKALATQLGITLLFLPAYSPDLNLIERLWKFIKRRSLYGR